LSEESEIKKVVIKENDLYSFKQLKKIK